MYIGIQIERDWSRDRDLNTGMRISTKWAAVRHMAALSSRLTAEQQNRDISSFAL
jgi:hypothetical protein